MRWTSGRHTQQRRPRRHLPEGFPAGVRRVVDIRIDDEQPFSLGRPVCLDDQLVGEQLLLVVVGYEIHDDIVTWYLGEPVHDWSTRRELLLADLQHRSGNTDPSHLGPTVRSMYVPIASLSDHPDLHEGAIVDVAGTPCMVASYEVDDESVVFDLRALRSATDDATMDTRNPPEPIG